MNDEWKYNPKDNKMHYTITYSDALRKKTVTETLNKLHNLQLDMIDRVVDSSNCAEAKEVLRRIMKK